MQLPPSSLPYRTAETTNGSSDHYISSSTRPPRKAQLISEWSKSRWRGISSNCRNTYNSRRGCIQLGRHGPQAVRPAPPSNSVIANQPTHRSESHPSSARPKDERTGMGIVDEDACNHNRRHTDDLPDRQVRNHLFLIRIQ